MKDQKRFPLLYSGQRPEGAPQWIPWWVAATAYEDYAARYGRSQSLQRLAERGGFAPEEMDVHLPGWRVLAGLEQPSRDGLDDLCHRHDVPTLADMERANGECYWAPGADELEESDGM